MFRNLKSEFRDFMEVEKSLVYALEIIRNHTGKGIFFFLQNVLLAAHSFGSIFDSLVDVLKFQK